MNIAVIGCGNMAFPIVTRIAKSFPEIIFHTFTPSKIKAQKLAKEVNGKFHETLDSLIDIDYWLIACKPQQLQKLSESLGDNFKEQKIISILASTNFLSLEKNLRTKDIIRVMPNTPASIGEGISLMSSSPNMDSKYIDLISNYFKACGEVINVDSEKEFDELTVFSGSGPAYVFRFANSYYKKLLDLGHEEELARKLVNQLFLGSSHLMMNDSENLGTMIDKVTSKAGVTIEAIKVLEKNSIDQIISDSIDGALLRGKQIAQDT